ncbi:MAG: PEP-CTERM sorting domain-containing protein [Sulfuritalea sp.]|nr:PEP-CTERM sorting domain-containing protein [Sulfuritalea sp.]
MTPFGTPTSVGSAAYGDDAYRLGFFASAPVPEPETYAMFLAGLGMLVLARRRRAG